MGMGVRKLQEMLVDREAWRAAVHGVAVRHDRVDWNDNPASLLVLFPAGSLFSSDILCGCWVCFYAVVSSGF